MAGDAFGPWPGNPDGGTGTGGSTTPAIIDAIPPWPGSAPDLQAQLTIAGVIVPGLVTFTGELGRKLDVKNAKGSDGATITDDGADPETIEIQVIIWNAEQWTKFWTEVAPLVNPNNTKGKLAPVDVSHPVLYIVGVKRAYVEKMSLPKPGKIPQTQEFTIRMRGWRPEPKNPTSKSKTPEKAAGTGSGSEWYQEGNRAEKGVKSGAETIKKAYGADSGP
jgi:hypothetical protein